MQQPDHKIYEQLPAIVKRYQLPNSRKAAIQILNSFLPFIAIWILIHATLIYLLGWQAFTRVHFPILLCFGTIAIWFFYVQHQHEHTYKA